MVQIQTMQQIQWPRREKLAQLPTPFHRLERFGIDLPTRIWLKRDDLTGFVLSGNKVRKLEFILAHAQHLGIKRVVTCGGLQSNHCRATAFACAQLGLQCHLILRGSTGSNAAGTVARGGNYLLDQIAGADISIHQHEDYSANLTQLLAACKQSYEQQGEPTLIIPTGASDGLGIWGYALAAYELMADFDRVGIAPAVIACATGSGGTQAGLALGFALAGYDVDLVGYAVCDSSQYFKTKVQNDLNDWQALNPELYWQTKPRFRTEDRFVGAGYGRATTHELKRIHNLAKNEGVLLDPVYTGKAFNGFVTDIEEGAIIGDDAVFVHTGGGFGVFPYEPSLNAICSNENLTN
jgi:D-cysteine desulfhydrase